MIWWILFTLIGLVIFIVFGRAQLREQSPLAAIRAQFQNVARMRLIAACPELENVLSRVDLRLLFDWMIIQLYRHTGTGNFGELMMWSSDRQEEFAELTGRVAREAIDRLPRPALAVIDECRGRTFAAVVIDESLTQSSHRIGLEPKRRAA